MKKIITLITFFFAFQFVHAQVKKTNHYFSYVKTWQPQFYLGNDSVEVRKMLYDYLLHYHYNAKWVQTDSSIQLAITHDSASWVIYSEFYFDSSNKCYAFTNERCDSFGLSHLKKFLEKSIYNWHKIDDNKYLSDFEYSELLEVQIDNDCVAQRRTKLQLTRKQYRQLKRHKKKE